MKLNIQYKYYISIVLLLFLLLGNHALYAQNLSGRITDALGEELPRAVLTLEPGSRHAVSDVDGFFIFRDLPSGEYILHTNYMGFRNYSDTIHIESDLYLTIKLTSRPVSLQEVIVSDHYTEHRKREQALNIEIVNDDYIRQHMSGSLMQSLERLPGVGTIEIGSGQSKPVIRGLGFNRVVVLENNIKHEGQQWGSDHGLEIDRFAADRVEIIKGPSSLMYGSDAIGGVIHISRLDIPAPKSAGGSADFTFAGNNKLWGTSAYAFVRGDKLFFSMRGTISSYADYRVPTDSISIYSYRAGLHNRQMRNTAGKEQNLHLAAGYIENGFSTRIFASAINSQNGFFANAHGLEPRRIDTSLHDASDRDIQYPRHEVEHLKIISKTHISKSKASFDLNLGIQRNTREELSDYVSHGYMPATFPAHLNFDSNLERRFEKHIYSGNAGATIEAGKKTSLSLGISTDYQQNEINGRGFIIPAFKQYNSGVYALGTHTLTPITLLHAGLRADYGSIHIEEYTDWYTSPIGTNGDQIYAQRSANLSRTFSSFNWALGSNHNFNNVSIKFNAGKSFRMPTAQELSANGVNYHRFSYEKGDSTLSPETAYQLDAGLEWNTAKFAIGISPYINYFSNYIYLSPDYRHDHNYGNGNQIFNYTQAEVFRYGGEIHSHYSPVRYLTFGLIGEYVFAQQLSGSKRGFTLPFSPPPMLLLSAKYIFPHKKILNNAYLSADLKLLAPQNRIVPPEVKTPGYNTVNLSAGGIVYINKQALSISIQVKNLMNKEYFNHTSYYRLINVPEPGRNFILNVHIPINNMITKYNHSH